MLHHTISWIIALRVLLCPVICAGEATAARSSHPMASQQAAGCSCGCHSGVKLAGSDSASEKDGDQRTPLSDPCCSDCFCHSLVGSTGKLLMPVQHLWQTHLTISTEIVAACTSYEAQFIKSPQRLDLPSGLAIRLALASLLI